jgi:hypothetical protein
LNEDRRQSQTDDSLATDALNPDRVDLDEGGIEFVDGEPRVRSPLDSGDPGARPSRDDAQLRKRLREVLDPPADQLLDQYYDPHGRFAGANFDTLGVNELDRVGPDDLLAVSMLDIRIRPRALQRLLGPGQEQIAQLLTRLPTEVDLWDATEDDHAAIDTADRWLRRLDGFGPVAASKLLARKRPRLVPVVDRVVLDELKQAHDAYTACRHGLARWLDDAHLQQRLHELSARLPDPVSPLRALDVAPGRGVGSS